MGVIDCRSDLADEKAHLNNSGAIKVSKSLGNWLAENYGIPDHRRDVRYENWENDLVYYEAANDLLLNTQDDITTFLMLLYGHGYEGAVTVFNDDTLKDRAVSAQLEKLGEDFEIIYSAASPDKADMTVTVRRSGELVCEKNFNYVFDPRTERLILINP